MNLANSNILLFVSIVVIILIAAIILLTLNVIPNSKINTLIGKVKIQRFIEFFNFKINIDKFSIFYSNFLNFLIRIRDSIVKFLSIKLFTKFVLKQDKKSVNINAIAILFLLITFFIVFIISPYK
ncbi:MAG: hypothetical protein JXA68_02575 [Ignavibacteriales bacterium]|nr:hypothetical protein [Ignavibacteriales bacterium]